MVTSHFSSSIFSETTSTDEALAAPTVARSWPAFHMNRSKYTIAKKPFLTLFLHYIFDLPQSVLRWSAQVVGLPLAWALVWLVQFVYPARKRR
jgi:hypothetical protein